MLELDSSLRDALMSEIAAFIQQVHSFPVDTAKRCGVKAVDFKEKYASQLEDIRRNVYHLLDTLTITYVEKLHEDYLSDEKNFEYMPVLLHADLSPDHIIYDHEKRAIAGVIDFGDVQIGDPDYDLVYLYEDYWGEGFIREFLRYYSHDDPERLLAKLEFFSRSNTIRDILIAKRREDRKVFQEALSNLKEEAYA